jgi:FdhD protein
MSGTTRPIRRHRMVDGHATGIELVDAIAEEWPVALYFNGMPHAVMLATPQDLPAFALGFALSEGLLRSPDECHEVTVTQAADAFRVDVRIEGTAMLRLKLKRQRRTLAGASGCGLCGVESLEMLDLDLPRVTHREAVHAVAAPTVLRAVAALPAHQVLNALNGATHAAAWVSLEGEILQVGEDVGRHNALDKMIGHRARAGGFESGFALVSSRASFELVSKCVRLGIGMMVAISAPTTLAIDMARRCGLRLMGWARGNQLVEYTSIGEAS